METGGAHRHFLTVRIRRQHLPEVEWLPFGCVPQVGFILWPNVGTSLTSQLRRCRDRTVPHTYMFVIEKRRCCFALLVHRHRCNNQYRALTGSQYALAQPLRVPSCGC